MRGRGGRVNVSGLDVLSLPFALALPLPDPLGLPRRPLVGFSSSPSGSETTLLDLAPSFSFILRDGRGCGAGERLAETGVDGGAGDVSFKSLVERREADREVDLEGAGGGWGESSRAAEGVGGARLSGGGRGVIVPDDCVFLSDMPFSPRFGVSELASTSSARSWSWSWSRSSSSLTLGARSGSSSDMSILEPGLSGPAGPMESSCSASDEPF